VIVEPFIRRLAIAIAGLSVLMIVGAVGYALLEGWPLSDGLYMTLITLSTVGYSETHELSAQGRWFTSALIVTCVVGMTLLTAALTSLIVENDLSGKHVRKRMVKMISKLKNHTVVCGCGKMAEAVIERLMQQHVELVVVGEDRARLNALGQRFRNLMTLEGDPTNELLLAKANVLRADNVVAALESDVDNLMICITCSDMGRDISVYARSNDISIANRMRKSGARNVISPSRLCGDSIANSIADPSGVSKDLEENALV
jgi:voltage-gated potassium channel